MLFGGFLDGNESQDDKGFNQFHIDETKECYVERLEFGYVKEVFWDDMGIKHSHIYHEQKEISVDEIWEVHENGSGLAPLELLAPEGEPTDQQ